MNSFVRELCYRSLLPKHLPKDTSWTQLPVLRTAELRQLSTRDFLTRLRLKQGLDAAATAKVEKDNGKREGPIHNLPKLVEDAKEKFVARARSYIVTVLEKFLGHYSLNADRVRGMACFDPHVLLTLLLDQAYFCFAALYRNFSLRGWLEGSSEDDKCDEYLEFVGHFRQGYSCFAEITWWLYFTDMVEILSSMPELKSRPHLYQLFRLSFLFLTEETPLLPPIRFQDVDSQSLKCRLADVLLPSQSYLAGDPDAITVCTNEDSIVKFRKLVEQFNSGNVAGDPWTHVDTFRRNNFLRLFTQNTSPMFMSLNQHPLAGLDLYIQIYIYV